MKTRPCLIISNNAQNKKSLRVIAAPITSNVNIIYPFEARVTVNGREGKAMLDQIRAIDKQRLGKKVLTVTSIAMEEVDAAIKIALSLK